MFCFLSILICSIVSFSNCDNFVTYFNGASCYFLQFFYKIINGNHDDLVPPMWMGFSDINKQLDITPSVFPKIVASKDVFDLLQDIKTLNEQYYGEIEKLIQNGKTKIPNPNDEAIQKQIAPVYSSEFTKKKDKSNSIGKIETEYNKIIKNNYDILDTLSSSANTLVVSGEQEAIAHSLDDIKDEMLAFSK